MAVARNLVVGYDDSDCARSALDAAVEVALRAERSVDALLSLAEERDARAIVVGTYGEHRSRAQSSARRRTSCCT